MLSKLEWINVKNQHQDTILNNNNKQSAWSFFCLNQSWIFLSHKEGYGLRVFLFPGPRPSTCPLALALPQNLYLPALTPNFYLPVLAYIFIISPEPELAYTDLVPPICIYWLWPTVCITGPGPEFAFTFLLVVILAVVIISLE